jgi:hypothetical protein
MNTFCQKCGQSTRLLGIEPHQRLTNTDVWTFECTNCGNFDVVTQPLSEHRTTTGRASALN